MKELWIQATEVYNLPLTIGLICFCLYWIISSIGILDIDADLDIDTDIDVEGGSSILGSLLNFVNATDVPVMLFLTVLNTFMWGISMLSNEWFNQSGHLGIAAGLLLVNFIISVLFAKYMTKPLAPLFNAIKKDVEAAEPLIGQTGIVKSRVLDHNYGQVEVPRLNTAPALVNCKLRESDRAMVRGEEVLIISHDKQAKKYLVRSLAGDCEDRLVISETINSEDNLETNKNDNLTEKE